MKLTEKFKTLLEEKTDVVLATVGKDGAPNAVSLFFSKVLDDEHILLCAVFMNKTLENLKDNNKVALVAYKTGQTMVGFQIKGTATVEVDTANHEAAKAMVAARGLPIVPRAAVVIKVDTILDIAPGPNNGKIAE